MINKESLNKSFVLYQAQPVGNGYTDIIVRRENIRQFVEFLVFNEIRITRITWWEYVENKAQSKMIGHGGPQSRYHQGWFSELCFGDDEVTKATVKEIMNIIKNKEITFSDGKTIRYQQDEFLTPALCLAVPNDWESKF